MSRPTYRAANGTGAFLTFQGTDNRVVGIRRIYVESPTMSSALSTVKTYTAAPTSGTSVGNLSSHRVFSHKITPAADGLFTKIEVVHADEDSHYILLRGANEGVELAFENAPGSTVTLTVHMEWVEQ